MSYSFWARVAYHRACRSLDWRLHPRPWASEHQPVTAFPEVAVARTSPLRRAPDGAIAAYTDEKIHNLCLATAKVDGLVIQPGEVFSFCRTVGKTTRRQGYLPALELHNGKLLPSVGGGLCQLANLLFLLALEINGEIQERHRHSFDLFRDVERTIPFGCGATVFYNYIDFQFRNRLPFPICLHTVVAPPVLRACVLTEEPLPFHVRLVETDHRFFREHGQVYRTNRIWREVEWLHDHAPTRELLFCNVCRVLYPADDLVTEG